MKSSKLTLVLLLTLFFSSIDAEILSFSKAYELALENANSLKASIFKAESTKERVAQEKSRLYPQISLSAYYKKSALDYNENYNNSGEIINQGRLNYGISLKQSIYNASVYSKITMETSRSELYKVGVELEKEQLAQSVFKAYLDLLKTRNRIKLYESYLEYSESKLDELNKKYEMYMVSKMDLLEMKVEYQSAQIDLTKEKKILQVNRLKLKKLIGDIEYELPVLESDRSLLESMEDMKLAIIDKENFSDNLQLLQATIALRLSKEEITNSFDAHYPTLDLQASMFNYDTDDPTADSLYKNINSVMLMLNVPIYSGGATSARVKELEYTSKAAAEELLDVGKEIRVQYDEYLALFEASVESVSMYKDAYASSILYVDSIEQGYNHGLKSIIDLNDAKIKQYEVKYKYIENMFEMVDSYIGLLILTNNFEHLELLDRLIQE